ncbi:quinoprotein relay system zinc metallohydrolase 2 [Sulfitobacter sp. D35]|uniref:quinoprotein relay system zinc metallohydrolase 2 n=1 Tax=Sulfitobacter sp. D35 TaxID=3083252 RepID=UPI00296E52AF|nr:quinoprotein relay system zinc metallohydrolase 2 [Sulfitobacter sp. D35]MDW4498636.1 quinoprotein relay system zinc metallohydrolase 2 [Sulfitobacter sp. D35]
MFEAIVTLCLLGDPQTCRDALLPGYEGADRAACEAALLDDPPDLIALAQVADPGMPHCAETGPALAVEEVATGVFVHRGGIAEAGAVNRGDVSNAGFVIGETAVAVIDTGGSRAVGEALYRAVRSRTDLPIRTVILTHMHPDHVLGASVFAEAGAEVIGHARLPRALADRAQSYLDGFGRLIGPVGFLGTEVPETLREVTEVTLLDLGGRSLELRAWRAAHTGTDLTVLDSESGLLFAGDLVFADHAPALDGSLTGWQRVLEEIGGMPLAGLVPGHGGPLLDWPEGGAPLVGYLDVLAADTRAAIDRGDTLSEAVATVAQSEADEWSLFRLFNPRNATVAYTELEWE